MEFLPFSFHVLVPAFIFFLLLLLQVGKRRPTDGSPVNLPPGPSKLPFIGNMHNLIGPLPHRTLRDLANKYGAIMHLQLGGLSAIVISSPELAREVMMVKDAMFASRPAILAAKIITYGCRDIAFAPYGEYWRQIKKLCTTELLNAKRVKSFLPIRDDESTKLIRSIAANEGFPINLTNEVESLIYTITSRSAFGLRCQDQEKFIHAAQGFVQAVAGFSFADVYPSAKWLHYATRGSRAVLKLHQEADRILEKIIEKHRLKMSNTGEDDESEAEDLVDVLLKYLDPHEDQFHLTMDDIKAVIMDVFIAGSDTSATTIDWAMSEMVKSPGVLAKAQDEVRDVFGRKEKVDETCITELHYLKSVIKETLRLHPPTPLLLPRISVQGCKVGGYDIPAETKVLINAWAIGRDPRNWTDPEKFCPERFSGNSIDFRGTSFNYIPFGAGRRMCPGITYAMANVEMVLAYLLYHFNWNLPNGMTEKHVDMTEGSGVNIRRKYPLELIPTVHHHPCYEYEAHGIKFI